ncbi:hypothetical protein TREES_T100009157 [Tupaia chinensis]|uniref:Uncharacterized protein n=1 Tax=Tupaia chinensis TaxID=246437 RepID=L9KFY4_TUPCH|nr:hypothetical protein TREES_T100009157 [Tupaia chinensis]
MPLSLGKTSSCDHHVGNFVENRIYTNFSVTHKGMLVNPRKRSETRHICRLLLCCCDESETEEPPAGHTATGLRLALGSSDPKALSSGTLRKEERLLIVAGSCVCVDSRGCISSYPNMFMEESREDSGSLLI